ncbi:GDP/GTP exchange factor Sec2p, putative [Trichophyton benhamiae CBS 112371]|uniref:GDP/GTP exchange factor Sec2p, putative n=1 Tax=Arthroderma benhamiae (strain ATCC MYA-4681 / CBS 112371) TaxID=663331 RepID=D4ASS7_ARTBC|nr:GDP/GTP exchange factor Sec2p, putative [Trichophyton benhamiae CBS 112371]EFE33827.1 GDP/GTP exchange factor Sec2p, putative [Trichophyton benhamiae CBS 112371]
MAAAVAQGPSSVRRPKDRDRERDRDREKPENSLSTLRDPRVASTSDLSRTRSASTASHHPDLSNEVANLSDKLIQAINHQTLLDDSLAVARQELEEERRRRSTVEKEKKGIETELETLTAALFEEANKMVAAAKQEREAVERKNEQLRAQIKDTELLLASHQEQLAELKSVIEQMNSRHDDQDTATTATSISSPSDPFPDQPTPNNGNGNNHNINRLFEAMNLSPVTPGSDDIPPAPPTSFSHLLKPVCRTDILAYEDFNTLLQLSRSRPPSRVGSGSYSGLNVMNLANLTSSRPKSTTHTPTNSQDTNHNGSNSSNVNTGSPAAASSSVASSPSTSHGGISSSPRENITSSMQLKETRFYKRILAEDIEPTLRLDMAPGISWLTRRSVMSSLVEGELIIEPIPSNTSSANSATDLPSPPSTPSSMSSTSTPCALCGDRRTTVNPRTHRFRTSSSDSAPKHALCLLCLEKMRACCEFVGYLRLVVDGHVRTGGDGEAEIKEREREAWEETVRLRERIFWARIGGGVVPAFISGKKAEDDSEKEKGKIEQSDDAPLVIKDITVTSPVDAKQTPVSTPTKPEAETETTEQLASSISTPTPTPTPAPAAEAEPSTAPADTPSTSTLSASTTTTTTRSLSLSPSRYRSRSPSPSPKPAPSTRPATAIPPTTTSTSQAPRTVLRRLRSVPPPSSTPQSPSTVTSPDTKFPKVMPVSLRASLANGTSTTSTPSTSGPAPAPAEGKLKVKIPAAFLHDN